MPDSVPVVPVAPVDFATMYQPVGHRMTPAALMVKGTPIAAVQVEIDYLPALDADPKKLQTIVMMWRADDLLDFQDTILAAVEDANKNYLTALADAEAQQGESHG